MKKITFFLLFILINNAFSQNGKIYLKNAKFKAGVENTYVYEPPAGLVIEPNSKANVLYAFDDDFGLDLSPVKKSEKGYEFTAKVPDAARTILVVISDLQKIADNNNNKGYIVPLKTENESELGKTQANEIFIRHYGINLFKLDLDDKPENLVPEYEALFKKYPELKNDKPYFNYLYNLGKVKKSELKDETIAFAERCMKKNTESSLVTAYYIYGRYGMTAETEKIKKDVLKKYPNGEMQKTTFIQGFIDHPDKNEAYVLESINTLKTKFNDHSKRSLSYFYGNLARIYLDKKDLEKAKSIESYLYNPSSTYNDAAWILSGESLKAPGKDLDFAAAISKRSLDLLEEKKKENYFPDYQSLYNMYADTYAHILYKQGKYKEAFNYQDNLRKIGGLDSNGKECYLAILEKVKSQGEIKEYIENEINSNTVPPAIFITKLKEIYAAQNLPPDGYEKLKEKADQNLKAARAKNVIDTFGTAVATDFALKNMEGKEVKLSDYRGKVVVLDFWATWCGPCKASFPKMQELVAQYKDKDVAFLFINTWENKKEDEVLKNVTNYITEKKYNFNVVFDSKSEVVANYRINGIPTSILIGKDGNILFSGHDNGNLEEMIDNELK
ncbi:thiol-disulfide isomerase/thioredoxin [Flavobacterium sp. HSC-32F16]|uniref:TlpA disulfide reductase family protein n=1 Tax=Flavobacterium sp. HSC-32F16 TaxID=2910964 RepID=UPI0020A46A81|nr:TlpA disulfide reductase family protein [Flavobacterium sp. HSC-32F16]MCP2028722.1 thiol-disulfide isomerase/thioredoxin [Flavobacterium sp. HSC-32F16]